MIRPRIHITMSFAARQHVQAIQDANECTASAAVENIIAHNQEVDKKLRSGLIDTVIDEVLTRYMGTRR